MDPLELLKPRLKGSLQCQVIFLFGIRAAHAHERVSTDSFVILMLGNSKSNHLVGLTRVESLRHTGHLLKKVLWRRSNFRIRNSTCSCT